MRTRRENVCNIFPSIVLSNMPNEESMYKIADKIQKKVGEKYSHFDLKKSLEHLTFKSYIFKVYVFWKLDCNI